MGTLTRILLFVVLVAPILRAEDDANSKGQKEAAKAIAQKLASDDDEEVFTGLHEAALNQDGSLTAPLIKLLKSRNTAVRCGAIETLAARKPDADRKKAAHALAVRLQPLADKETDREELMKVIKALHDLAEESTIKALLDSRNDEDRDVRQARAMAVANVPSKEAIERLIQYGYKDRRGTGRTRDIATKALAYATGAKVDGSIEGWRKWWSEHEKDFDPIAAAERRAAKASANAAKAEQKKARQDKRNKKNDEA